MSLGGDDEMTEPSIIVAATLAGLLGALIGSLLTVVAWRVPQGVLLLSGRSSGGAVAPRLWADIPVLRLFSRQKSADAHDGIAVPTPVLEVLTGALFAIMAWRFGVSWVLPAYLLLAAMAVLLSVIDFQHRRLPDVIVGPFAVAAVFLLVLASWGEGSWWPLLRATVGAVILFVMYLVLALISPTSMGMGDVKLAGVLGLLLAFLSWRTLILGAAGAFVLVALVGIMLLVARKADRRTMVPFGPAMSTAALAAVILVVQ